MNPELHSEELMQSQYILPRRYLQNKNRLYQSDEIHITEEEVICENKLTLSCHDSIRCAKPCEDSIYEGEFTSLTRHITTKLHIRNKEYNLLSLLENEKRVMIYVSVYKLGQR